METKALAPLRLVIKSRTFAKVRLLKVDFEKIDFCPF